jgi:hypothetical protein
MNCILWLKKDSRNNKMANAKSDVRAAAEALAGVTAQHA